MVDVQTVMDQLRLVVVRVHILSDEYRQHLLRRQMAAKQDQIIRLVPIALNRRLHQIHLQAVVAPRRHQSQLQSQLQRKLVKAVVMMGRQMLRQRVKPANLLQLQHQRQHQKVRQRVKPANLLQQQVKAKVMRALQRIVQLNRRAMVQQPSRFRVHLT